MVQFELDDLVVPPVGHGERDGGVVIPRTTADEEVRPPDHFAKFPVSVAVDDTG